MHKQWYERREGGKDEEVTFSKLASLTSVVRAVSPCVAGRLISSVMTESECVHVLRACSEIVQPALTETVCDAGFPSKPASARRAQEGPEPRLAPLKVMFGNGTVIDNTLGEHSLIAGEIHEEFGLFLVIPEKPGV